MQEVHTAQRSYTSTLVEASNVQFCSLVNVMYSLLSAYSAAVSVWHCFSISTRELDCLPAVGMPMP